VKDKPKGYKSFQKSGHTKSAFDFMNESISDYHSSKGTGNKYNGFGPANFPLQRLYLWISLFKIFLLGKGIRPMIRHTLPYWGHKPVEGLVLDQSTWANSESSLRLMSGVLGTAEHCMAVAGSLLKDKGDEFDELKSLHLQVDQTPGVSQLLLMSTLSNFTLSKRQEMLDKSPIAEPLMETFLFSPLMKDKLFGLPLGKLQEEVSKTPQTVKVDVQVCNGQRGVTTSQSHSETGPMTKGSGKPSGYRKRSATRNSFSTTGKKAKVVQGNSMESHGPSTPSVQPPDEEKFFPTPFPHIPVGVRLAHFLNQWHLITSDKWVLSVFRGSLELQFQSRRLLS
jgi:hypothetical protein